MMHAASCSKLDDSYPEPDEEQHVASAYVVLSPPEDAARSRRDLVPVGAARDLHGDEIDLCFLSTSQSDSTSDDSLPKRSPSPPCSFLGPSPSPTSSTFSTTSCSSSGGREPGSRRKYKYKFIRGKRYYCHVVDEEKAYCEADDIEEDEWRKKIQFRCFLMVLAIAAIFSTFCAVYLSASRHYKLSVLVQRLEVGHLYYGEGSDHTGVPTKLLTANCSATVVIRNPAKYFGVHISSSFVDLMYSQLIIANGQIDKYYQPRNSLREMKVGIVGHNVPLYGTGEHLIAADERGGIPLKLKFKVHSIGYLIGNLVKARHTRQVSCSLVISSEYTKEINLQNNCEYS